LPLWQRLSDRRFEPRQQIASAFDGTVSVVVMAYALLLFIPLSLALRYFFDAPAGWVFLTGAAAIAVLADWLRRATDQLAERAGSTIGGLLNISFGNTAELILALFVLSRVNTRIVQAQITGSIIGTTLLFFGISALVGGLGRVRQTFSQASAGLLSTLLFVVVVAILLPAVFDLTERIAAPGMDTSLIDERLSLGVSVVLLLLYAANLIYTLVTHRDVFAGQAASGRAEWSIARALADRESSRRGRLSDDAFAPIPAIPALTPEPGSDPFRRSCLRQRQFVSPKSGHSHLIFGHAGGPPHASSSSSAFASFRSGVSKPSVNQP
jgi:Ca2+/H+ antiporter